MPPGAKADSSQQFIACGEGALVKTFLVPARLPPGKKSSKASLMEGVDCCGVQQGCFFKPIGTGLYAAASWWTQWKACCTSSVAFFRLSLPLMYSR